MQRNISNPPPPPDVGGGLRGVSLSIFFLLFLCLRWQIRRRVQIAIIICDRRFYVSLFFSLCPYALFIGKLASGVRGFRDARQNSDGWMLNKRLIRNSRVTEYRYNLMISWKNFRCTYKREKERFDFLIIYYK